EQGLPSNLIFGVERDRRGFLWISTNGGISRLDPKTNRFRNFTKEDGLQSNSFIKKSHTQTRNGQMVFGGINGFNIFDPEKIVENRSISPVVITEFRIFNKPVPVGVKGSPLKKYIGQIDEIVLSFRQTTFSFQYSALNYVIPSKNQYAYFLEGFDKEWNAVGGQRQAAYTNIPPGKYLFRIKASNNDGVWNESGKSVRIIITPPFWQTTAFRIAFLCLLAGLLVAGYKMRTSRIRKMNRELEQRVRERTAQLDATNKELEAFSYSVSHDLRAPLRSMNGFGQALLEDYAERFDERGRDFLRRIQKASQHMSLLIDDLLKLSRLTRSDMVLRQTDLSTLVESVAEEFRYSDPAREVRFAIQKKVIVEADPSLLIVLVRNLIDNAWKFTSKRRGAIIEFGAKREKDRTVYYIKDNGIGFDMAYSGKLFEAFQRQHTEFEGTGIGLATVQRIVHRHGGSTWAEGKENEGAAFYFTLGQP
ncbi:MAG TPA: triple tyrosine motif-containing protein, partial [bacterium]